ncbi:MAG: hypothetical protein DCF17_13855 [Shackletoniella antarctica]|jgi:hypothetical protein|uniref:Uncharacterized protein n=1 Tax=Shackletoniella antarctica TaxID=268115 RepID=A0A2W4W2Y8_9CYAN|nr:MAG: hypothetical protein DCF17_13855 [Shackletoniella antarctica]
MATLTIEIPDDLMDRIGPIRDQLPELLRRCLQPDLLSAQVYRYILNFLASQPTPEQVAAFRPAAAMQTRLRHLLSRSDKGTLTPEESQELDEYENIEHLIILLKAGNLPHLTTESAS